MYFYVIFSDLKALFPLFYFIQNHSWASRPITNYVVLARKQVSFATKRSYMGFSIRLLGLYVLFENLALRMFK